MIFTEFVDQLPAIHAACLPTGLMPYPFPISRGAHPVCAFTTTERALLQQTLGPGMTINLNALYLLHPSSLPRRHTESPGW